VGLERIGPDGTTVVQTSIPAGTGQARSLRWENSTSTDVLDQTVRVSSGDCTTNCGSDDTYRVRAYETTLAIPRFNNTGTQVTVLLLQNSTDAPINGVAGVHAGGQEPAGAEHGVDPGGERRLRCSLGQPRRTLRRADRQVRRARAGDGLQLRLSRAQPGALEPQP
jgi:hypothetical protein